MMSWTQTCFGLGYMLGPGVGAWFYEMGGFMLPFLVVGALSTILSILLIFTIPTVSSSDITIEGIDQQENGLLEEDCDEQNGEVDDIREAEENGDVPRPAELQLR